MLLFSSKFYLNIIDKNSIHFISFAIIKTCYHYRHSNSFSFIMTWMQHYKIKKNKILTFFYFLFLSTAIFIPTITFINNFYFIDSFIYPCIHFHFFVFNTRFSIYLFIFFSKIVFYGIFYSLPLSQYFLISNLIITLLITEIYF